MRNALSIIGCFSLGFVFVACGGISGSMLDSPALDAGETAADDGGDLLEDGGIRADRDASANHDASAKDGAAAPAAVIDPIVPGEAWVYDVSVVGDFPACNDGTYTSTVGAKQSLDGRDSYLVSSFCPSLGSYSYS
ncbi:MAG: hypothetical protein ABI461_02550, partial [Polyangiaceae bacterium]